MRLAYLPALLVVATGCRQEHQPPVPLNSAPVVKINAPAEDMVFLGATVRLRDTGSGGEDLYKLVGEASGRFDTDAIEVTASSPMGEALMKARIGLPRGTKRFEILEII